MPPDRQPLVSVVTPVHNTGDYLAACIESVLGQSYQNWEYVIVDNRSTDNSLSIAEAYASKDSRIRIVKTDRLLPQVVNHNFALRQISGDSRYCKVVLADDWLFPECIRSMVELAATDDRIAIVGAYRLNGTQLECQGLSCPEPPNSTTSVLSGKDACRLYLLEKTYLFGNPTCLLYRSDLLRGHDPFYVELSNHGDAEACFEVLDGYQFGFVHQVLTFTRVGNVSVSNSVRTFRPHDLFYYIITKKYGPRYLTPKEHEKCLKDARGHLYTSLIYPVYCRRSKEFWEYHRMWLEAAGDKLDRSLLYRMRLWHLLSMIGNPKATLGDIFRDLVA